MSDYGTGSSSTSSGSGSGSTSSGSGSGSTSSGSSGYTPPNPAPNDGGTGSTSSGSSGYTPPTPAPNDGGTGSTSSNPAPNEGSSSPASSQSPDVFLNPSSDLWVEDLVRPPQPSDPPRKLPEKNIGYYSPIVPTSVPGWREYLPWNEPGTRPPNRDPVGWNCNQCYFKFSHKGKRLCTKYKFEIPSGSWRCDSWVTSAAKFGPFVKEQTPFANETTLPLVDQLGRFLIDVYKLVNVKPEKSCAFTNLYHSHSSAIQVPVFVLGPHWWRFLGASYQNWMPTEPKNWLPYYKFSTYTEGAVIPMSTTEKPGWIQYDIDPISSDFKNLRFLPKPNQDLDFLSIGPLEGHVAMYPKKDVELFESGGFDALPNSTGVVYSFRPISGANASWRLPGPEIVVSSGEDLVSSKPALIAVGEKSVSITLDPKIFLADKVAPVPVRREQLAVSEVSTGLLGIPREEKALNLFEDINRIGIDPTRWTVNKFYQFQSVEPRGWFDSYSVQNNPDEQLPSEALTYQTALAVESDEANAGVNLVCRTPISSFPYRDISGYGFSAWERAKDQWIGDVTFPAYGVPRRNVFSMVELLSRQYFAYQPGRITGFTFGVRACQPELVGSNSQVLWGIENDENAMYFRLNSGSFSVVRSRFNRKSPNFSWLTRRLETIPQGSFNGDNINGFGSSGYVMEWNKVTMFKIEYGWYGGVGARLYVYVPVGNKSAKWVRIHNFGPPQSDSEPDTPAELKNLRYPTLSTPWFRVFYRIISANGTVNDQGPLSLSKYGVSVYMDGGNLNSPQLTDVTADSKIIPPFNQTEPLLGENVFQKDTFPVLAFKFKPKMKKRITQDSISDASQGATVARTETTNYKVIVPKKLNITAQSAVPTTDITPIKVDLWLGESVKDSIATKGKSFSYPNVINYSITNPFVDPRNAKIINWPLNSNPWWTLVPPVNLTPDWKTDHGVNPTDLAIENRYCPTRPGIYDPSHRRYILGNEIGDPSVYLRGGIVSGVPTSVDGRFFSMRVFEAGTNAPDDPLLSIYSPYNYTLNNNVDQVAVNQAGNKLDFRHLDMCIVSDPIFESFFNFSFELNGPVYVGAYYHKPSSSNPNQKADAIARLSGFGSQNLPWKEMLEQEVADGMWPLFFSPYSLHGAYGLFSENPSDLGGFSHLSQTYDATKYIYDNTFLGLKFNTSFTRIVGGTIRGGGLDYIMNPNGFGVNFVFLLGPGGSVKNPTIITNATSNDSQKYSMRFLGQPDSAYANSSVHTFLSKIYGKSLVGVNGVNNFPPKPSNQTPYDYIKSLPSLSSSPTFKWGRPDVQLEVKESSERVPLNFKDYGENSGILIDTEATQKVDVSRFDLQASFFINSSATKTNSFDLSNFFSYNGTAIRGPGDYTFIVSARNLRSVEQGGVPVNITASLQCEEG